MEEGRALRRTGVVVAEAGSFLDDLMMVVGSALQRDIQLVVHYSFPGKGQRLEP